MERIASAGIIVIFLAGLQAGAQPAAPREQPAQVAEEVVTPNSEPIQPPVPARQEPLVASDRNLEIGGMVTLDHAQRLSPSQDPVLDLGEVALGANVTLTQDILASVVLKAEQDLDRIFFDQAMAQVTPQGGHWTFLFGQQTFNHGLLSTRLISDPEILPWLETNRPGLSAGYSRESFSAAGGLTLIESGEGETAGHEYAYIPNADWNHGPVQARLSGLFSSGTCDADAAVSLAWGPARIDAEGFLAYPDWERGKSTGGYLLGIEIELGARVSAAYRHDGVTGPGLRGLPTLRHGVGATLNLMHDLFAAAEISDGRGGESPGPRVALQLGLKSTLNLPGFQRETLTRD